MSVSWADPRCAELHDILYRIRIGHAMHSECYAICSEIMDKVEMLDDEIKEVSHD